MTLKIVSIPDSQHKRQAEMKKGYKFGSYRVLETKGVLPQVCWRLDNNLYEIYDNEILADVDRLNIDAASFHQMRKQARDDEEEIGPLIP